MWFWYQDYAGPVKRVEMYAFIFFLKTWKGLILIPFAYFLIHYLLWAVLEHAGSSVASRSLSGCGAWAQWLWHVALAAPSLCALTSLTRDQTCVPWIARWGLNHWATREVLVLILFKCW